MKILIVCTILQGLCLLMMYRINLLARYWKKASIYLIAKSRQLIDDGKYTEWQPLWDDFDGKYGSYGRQMFQIWKWSFTDFYFDMED